MDEFYIRTPDGAVKGATLVEYLKWRAVIKQNEALWKACQHVRVDYLYGKRISTVFLGFDHFSGAAKPLLFETMVLPEDGSYMEEAYCEQYPTAKKALAGHKRALEYALRNHISNRMEVY